VDVEQAAAQMVDKQLKARDVRDDRVLKAMQRVPRHRFVPEVDVAGAYADRALPTEAGQTISQPYIVARMTELLSVSPGMKVLEVGTGSGYQAAVLAEMGARVVGIEAEPSLVKRAEQILNELVPEASVQVVAGDGTLGYPEQAPFDRILITAAAPDLPEPLAEQLADPGRAVLPVGDRAHQVLAVMELEHGRWRQTDDTPCRFVPLTGAHGW